jgi:hypothetical protein
MSYETYEVRVYDDGTKKWYQKGERHRLDGPAIEFSDGTKEWYQNGKRHRLDGPACEWSDGDKHWCQNGKLHRLDGPALEYSDGTKSWYIEDVWYSEEEFNKKINPSKCNKVVTIDGVDYELKERKWVTKHMK